MKLVDLKLELRVDRDKAWGVADGTTEGKSKQLKLFWLPKSQVDCEHESPDLGKTYTFTMPAWLAVDKGLV